MADTEDHLLPMVMDEQLDADTDNKDPLLSMTMNQQSNKLLSGSNTEQNSGEASSVCILLENNTEIHQMFSVHSFRKQHREKQHLDTCGLVRPFTQSTNCCLSDRQSVQYSLAAYSTIHPVDELLLVRPTIRIHWLLVRPLTQSTICCLSDRQSVFRRLVRPFTQLEVNEQIFNTTSTSDKVWHAVAHDKCKTSEASCSRQKPCSKLQRV